eukprot:c21670_g1_i1.p1 GENE.c21670_g1_i1~~c21670_g1_i1.p1  ORF type:complete len:777 (+),score=247.00 c21670_g1_i1:165-2495(+)
MLRLRILNPKISIISSQTQIQKSFLSSYVVNNKTTFEKKNGFLFFEGKRFLSSNNRLHHQDSLSFPFLGVRLSVLQDILNHQSFNANMKTSDVCSNIIKPSTQELQCSYSELIQIQQLDQNTNQKVGPANIFVSHAWQSKFEDTVKSLEVFINDSNNKTKLNQDTAYFWFDFTCINQHDGPINHHEWLDTILLSGIKVIGRVILILPGWDNPIPLERSWCLWEIYCATISQSTTTISFSFPPYQVNRFINGLLNNFDSLIDHLQSKVDVVNSETFIENDKLMILSAVERTQGVHKFNQLINERIKSMVLSYGLDVLKKKKQVDFVDESNQNKILFSKLYHKIGLLLRDQGKLKDAETALLSSLQLYESVDSNHSDIYSILHDLAYCNQLQKKFEESKNHYKRLLFMQQKNFGSEHSSVATTWFNLALVTSDSGSFDESELFFSNALVIREKLFGPNHEDVVSVLKNFGKLYKKQGDFQSAEVYLQRVHEIEERMFGADDLRVASALNELGLLQYDQGKYEECEPLFKRALEIRVRELDSDHQDIASSLNLVAMLLSNQGKYEEAEPLYKNALRIFEKVYGFTHCEVATVLNNIAELYRAQEKFSNAETLHKRSIEILESILGPDHPDVATALNNLALLYSDQSKFEEAEPLYKRSLSIYESLFGINHADVALTLNNLGALYNEQGKYEDAAHMFKRALVIRERTLGVDHPDVAATLGNIGALYYDQGKLDDAATFYLRALQILELKLGSDHPSTRTLRENFEYLQQQRKTMSRTKN